MQLLTQYKNKLARLIFYVNNTKIAPINLGYFGLRGVRDSIHTEIYKNANEN